jgi:hypothetical protein
MNVLEEIERRLWNTLEGSTLFTAAVDAMNRVRHDGSGVRYPLRDAAGAGRRPEVRVRNAGLANHSTFDSCTHQVKVIWEVLIRTDEQHDANIDGALNRVVWSVLCAMSRWQTYFPADFTFGGSRCVTAVRPLECQYFLDGDPGSEQTWRCVWRGYTEICLPIAALQSAANP